MIYSQPDPGFLQQSTVYDIRIALEISRQRDLFEVQVYLLNRSGMGSEALQIILTKLKDVEKAVFFVAEYCRLSLSCHGSVIVFD